MARKTQQTVTRSSRGGQAPKRAKTREQRLRQQLDEAMQEQLDATIWVDGNEYAWGDFEYGELEAMEEYFGTAAARLDLGSARVQMFLVYLIRHRRDPDYALEDVRGLTLRDMAEIMRPPVEEETPRQATAKK